MLRIKREISLEAFKVACHYPGLLDREAVDAALKRYLAALSIKREIREIAWDGSFLLENKEIARATQDFLLDFEKLDARTARAARDARDAESGALRRFASWCIHRSWWWWSWDLSWIATTLIGAQQLGREIQWARPLFEAYVAGAWMLYWTDDTLYWIAKPRVHVERPDAETRRLHCEDSPAVESDLENLYFWHGVLVPAFVIVRPEWITTKHILDEENAEVRRVMLTRYGEDRFIRDSGALPIHSDGVADLYRVEVPNDEPLVMVRVLNSTLEPDGSRKTYWLRVHPEIRPMLAGQRFGESQEPTGRNAVASTFGLRGEQYAPVLET